MAQAPGRAGLLVGLLLLAGWLPASAALLPDFVEPPVFSKPLARGGVSPAGPASYLASSAKQVDGLVDDWVGQPTRLGGTAVLDRGEYVYQDHLFDDRGADDGKDAQRLALLGPLTSLEERATRVDMLAQALGEEFGLDDMDPTGGVLAAHDDYGDAAYPPGAGGHADLVEVRVAADAGNVYLVARVATMLDPARPALLLLADTTPGGAERDVPFGSGLTTTRAEAALLVTRDGVRLADLVTGEERAVPEAQVAVNPQGFVNAIEVALPRSLVADGPRLALALGAGIAGAGGLAAVATGEGQGQLMNVAFRREPVRVWFDLEQAMALHAGSIDAFFVELDAEGLASGVTQPVLPTPGYHERVFLTSPQFARETGRSGLHQPYGLYLPTSWQPGLPAPLTLWLRWRGGGAHSPAAWTPRLVEQLGEELGGMWAAPNARGTTSWYVGVGHADFLEVWEDLHGSFLVDEHRTYLAGMSMGGFGTYLLGFAHPDWFAGAFVLSGAVTHGAWFGLLDDGTDMVEANEGDANAELTYRLVENARNLPFVVFQGTNDQFVPASGTLRQAARFAELGQRYELYLFPGYDHYTSAILDEYRGAQGALKGWLRDADPARVVYKRIPALERAVETIHSQGVALDFDFDGAYWVDGLEVRGGDFADPHVHALVDARSLARPEEHALLPVTGAAQPGHSTPYLMHGLRWVGLPPPAPANAFLATLTNVASVQLDTVRMGLDAASVLEGTVASDGPAVLRLRGAWVEAPNVLLDGAVVPAPLVDGVLMVSLPGATEPHALRIEP